MVYPENLIDRPISSLYQDEGNDQQKDRRIVKMDKRSGIVYAIYGLSNKTILNGALPLRMKEYDYVSSMQHAQEYIEKLRAAGLPFDRQIWPGEKGYPVVMLVLYYGTQPWKGSTPLCEMIQIPEDLKAYIPAYQIQLFDVASMKKEQIEQFQSDFRIVAEYFSSKKSGNASKMIETEGKMPEHAAALMDLFHNTCK